jgi:hypothetical protein
MNHIISKFKLNSDTLYYKYYHLRRADIVYHFERTRKERNSKIIRHFVPWKEMNAKLTMENSVHFA